MDWGLDVLLDLEGLDSSGKDGYFRGQLTTWNLRLSPPFASHSSHLIRRLDKKYSHAAKPRI